MVKVIVVYESRYGNTRLAAEKIAEGMKQVAGTEVAVRDVKDIQPSQLPDYDIIIAGSPNHIGSATRNIGNLVNEMEKLHLDGKPIAVFDTCMTGEYEKVVKKLEKMISQKAPGMHLITSGLSIKVNGMKGPIAESDLPKCLEFGAKIARSFNK
jgi:menaquinone-dependent protoporphyrinogen IX oxidase